MIDGSKCRDDVRCRSLQDGFDGDFEFLASEGARNDGGHGDGVGHVPRRQLSAQPRVDPAAQRPVEDGTAGHDDEQR